MAAQVRAGLGAIVLVDSADCTAIFRATFRTLKEATISRTPLEDFRTAVNYVAEQTAKASNIKVEEIVGTSWLKQLERERLFEKL